MVNNEQEILREIIDHRIVGLRMVEDDDLREWKCVHNVDLHMLCDDCARLLSFRDEIEGK